MALGAGGDGAGMEGAEGASVARGTGLQWGQCWEEPGAPGAKAAGMSPLSSRRAGEGAPSLPLLLNPTLRAKPESSQAFLSSPPSREPSGVKGTVEMSWVVWGADAVGEDGEKCFP